MSDDDFSAFLEKAKKADLRALYWGNESREKINS
jgi:hypothetical protein